MLSLLLARIGYAQDAGVLRFADDRPAFVVRDDVPRQAVRPAAAAYDVIALRVEFQPDDSRFTTGDGTFEGDLFSGLDPVVDPLPHDADYFEARLAFLHNYIARVSSGRTDVRTHLLPGVVRMPETMAAYSPTGPESDSDEELRKLARLVADAWKQADASIDFNAAGFDPSTTAFVLFHAGVGRDIELIGTTLDKTPEDLPSLFFGEGTLERLLPGESVRFGGLDVDHTILLPRTETRRGENFITDEPFLAEFSVNGMLAATFFSYLGVPDLFNTDSGESGIGPFGLMDPLGIFAFNGLFPPEPGAWTKQYLGWSDQEVVDGAEPHEVMLRAASFPDASPQFRIPVSDGEYFLVENRHRDLHADGLRLTVWRDGEIVEDHFDNHSTGFSRFDISGFAGGVVVDASNFDWALPGGLDEDGNELNGGILIWHVDERRLLDRLADNRVNADPNDRAIDVKEADGSQDIGFPSAGDFGPQTHLGSPFDFYFRDNPIRAVTRSGREIRLYQNRFGPDTTPSSDTRAGGPSFVVLEDFSAAAAEMSLTYRLEEASGLRPDDWLGGIDLGVTAGRGSSVVYDGGERLFVYAVQPDASGVIVSVDVSTGETIVLTEHATARPALLSTGEPVFIVRDGNGLSLRHGSASISLPGAEIPNTESRPVVVEQGGGTTVLVVDGGSDLWAIDLSAGRSGRIATDVRTITALDDGRLLAVGSRRAAIHRLDGSVEASWDDIMHGDSCGDVVAGSDRDGLLAAFACANEEEVVLFGEGESRLVSLSSRPEIDGGLVPALALADLEGKGRLAVLAAVGQQVVALERSGAMAVGLPLSVPSSLSAEPLVFHRGGSTYLLVAEEDGTIHTLTPGDPLGRMAGTPLPAGFRTLATPLIFDDLIVALSAGGRLSAWRMDESAIVLWGQRFGGSANSFFPNVGSAEPPIPEESFFLIDSETYNWPNPIRESGTYVRVMTTRDAT
ncbi:MAG: hypothetical protein ACOCTG_02480, partial [Bacteroidota bacterium]